MAADGQEDGGADGRASLEAKLAPTLADIATWNERVEAFCDAHAIAGATLFHITLIFEELLTNVVNHGGSATAIDVGVDIDRELLHGRISDDGTAFDPLSLPEPDTSLDLDDRDIGGLGVHMVRKLAHSVAYERTGERNRLRFTLQLGSAGVVGHDD